MIPIPKTFHRRFPPPLLALTLAATLALGLAGCSLLVPETRVPMPSETVREAGPSGCVAILLPGRWIRMEAFREHGFAAAVEAAGLDLGLVAADAHIGYYREESVATRLAEDVVGPLLGRADGPERVFRRPGGHDWPVWTPLWEDVLASGEMCGPPV